MQRLLLILTAEVRSLPSAPAPLVCFSLSDFAQQIVCSRGCAVLVHVVVIVVVHLVHVVVYAVVVLVEVVEVVAA